MSETELEKHYRETLVYIADYAIKREQIVYCDHIAQVITTTLIDGPKLTSSSSKAAGPCACPKPTVLEKSYCTQCGRDMH